jgi:hypothetical protein
MIPLGWVSVEYAAIGLLAFLIPRGLASVLLLLTVSADLALGVCKTYLLAPSDCLQNILMLHALSTWRLLGVLAVATLIAPVGAIPFLLPAARLNPAASKRAILSLLTFTLLPALLDYASVVREQGSLPNPFCAFSPPNVNKLSKWGNLRLGRYPLIRVVHLQILYDNEHSGLAIDRDNSPRIGSATSVALAASGLEAAKPAPEMPNLVLILLESWGFNDNPALRNALTHPYTQSAVLARYRVLQGAVPFVGSTVSGETRELCGSTIGLKIADLAPSGMSGCLPNQLKQLGYRETSFHGMDGRVFARSTWYPRMGFDEEEFGDRLRRQGLPDCIAAFVGTCDASLADFIRQRLTSPQTAPWFLNWVTLNSHLPVPVPNDLPAAASCETIPELANTPRLCSWYQLVANVHESVARVAIAPLARPTVFVIVGDHAPPFVTDSLRNQFSRTEVPYVILAGAANEEFLKAYIGKSDSAYRATWRSLVFSGAAMMPKTLEGDAAVVAFVQSHSGSIGYIDKESPHAGVKVLTIK